MLVTDKQGFLLTATGDLDISAGTAQFATGLIGVAQAALVRVRNIKGEWFLNKISGVPLIAGGGVPQAEAILGQKFDARKAEAAFRTALEAVPAVSRVLLLQQTFNSKTRKLSSRWQLRTAFGDTPVQEATA